MDGLEQTLGPSNVPSFSYAIIFQLGAILGIILASSAVGAEYGWRTIVLNTAWIGDRVRFVLAKLVTLAAMAAIGVVAGFFAGFFGSLIVGIARQSLTAQDFTGTLLSQAVLGGIRTWYVILIYMLLAAALAFLGRSTLLGIAVGLAILFLEGVITLLPTLFGERFAFINDILISANVEAVLSANSAVGSFSMAPRDGPPPWQGAGVLAIYAVIFVTICVLSFNRRDITE
jgi:ABC-2 type transport system permease protein